MMSYDEHNVSVRNYTLNRINRNKHMPPMIDEK